MDGLVSFQYLNRLSNICFNTKKPLPQKDVQSLERLFSDLFLNDIPLSCINSWFKLQGNILPLECLWQLQLHNFIQFTTYIHQNVSRIPELRNGFEELIWCQDDSIRSSCSEVVAGLMAVLINLGIHTPRDIYKPGSELLLSIMEEFVLRLLGDSLDCGEPVPFLSSVLSSPNIAQSRLQAFCLSTFRLLIHSSAGTVAMEEALRDQTSYTLGKSLSTVSQLFCQIISQLPEGSFVYELSHIIMSQKYFNWHWLLTAVSAYVASIHNGAEVLKGMIEGWVTQACATKNNDLLAAGLLCARQCCAENALKFGSYSSWFGGLQLRPASTFTFFFEFLSQIVPHEPVLCLKIHVNKVPSIPPNCHSVVADYVTLAKTRLADLNQTTDYVGLFGEYTTTEQEGRESDVLKVISNFKQTKEVMKIVLEASVFRRQFYEKTFLPELLKDGNPERVEFIEKLYSIGKIPHGLYNRWRQSYF